MVMESNSKPINLTCNQISIQVQLVAFSTETDLALMQVLDNFVSTNFLTLRESTVVNQLPWRTFGCPANNAGQLVGEPLNGTIAHIIADSTLTVFDLTFNVAPSGLSNAVYEGFSGSPILNDSGYVIGVMKYEGSNHLHGVSIKKGSIFLGGHGLQILPDELEGFEDYTGAAFDGFEPDAKALCNSYAVEVSKALSPTAIATTLLGDVYFPRRTGNLRELIAEMKKDAQNNSLLWTGWIELLSHVALLEGEQKDVNAIKITIPISGILKMLGLSNKNNSRKSLQLRFLWTKEEHYFSVVKDYLRGNLKLGMENDTCYIFNARSPNFGGGELKPGFKKNIIGNISAPRQSGPSVMGKVKYGILSLRHLNDQVKQCITLQEATDNLEKLFKDAIEQS